MFNKKKKDNKWESIENYNKIKGIVNMANPHHNVRLSDNIYLNLNRWEARQFSNTLLIGCSGSYKTVGHIASNIALYSGNYVITSNHGYLYDLLGKSPLPRRFNGERYESIYKKILFSPVREDSSHYNPLFYIKDIYKDKDMIDMIVSELISNETDDIDPIYKNYETSLLTNAINYVLEYGKDKNLSEVHQCFIDVDYFLKEDRASTIWGKAFMDMCKILPEKVKKVCYINIIIALQPYITDRYKDDGLDLKLLTFSPTMINKLMLFIDLDFGKNTYKPIINILLKQTFILLIKQHNYYYRYEPNIELAHTRYLFDNFEDCGLNSETDDFLPTILITCGKYNISTMFSIQTIDQIHKCHNFSILDNITNYVFLTNYAQNTLHFYDEVLGKTVIVTKTKKGTTVKEEHFDVNIPLKKCIVYIKGHKPIYDDSINIGWHNGADIHYQPIDLD